MFLLKTEETFLIALTVSYRHIKNAFKFDSVREKKLIKLENRCSQIR